MEAEERGSTQTTRRRRRHSHGPKVLATVVGRLATTQKTFPVQLWGRGAQNAKTMNHFACVCKSGKDVMAKHVAGRESDDDDDDDNDDDDDYAFAIEGARSAEMVDVVVGGVNLSMVIDSGASNNIIDQGTWEELKKKVKCKSEANETSKSLFANVNGSKDALKVLGSFVPDVSLSQYPNNRQTCKTEFVVFDGNGVSLLGKETAQTLGVLRVGLPCQLVGSVNEKPETKGEFKGLFSGLGKLKDRQIKLHVKPTELYIELSGKTQCKACCSNSQKEGFRSVSDQKWKNKLPS